MKYKYDVGLYEIEDKEKNVQYMIEQMLNKTMSMFKWSGLPNTIPQRSLELFLQTNGSIVFAKHNDDICLYTGGLGGKPDYLYRPSIITIANPAQDLSVMLPLNWDEITDETPDNSAIICLNDPLLLGVLPISRKHATLLAENELTIWLTDILMRSPWLLSGQDEKTLNSARNFLENIFKGKLGVITDSAFLDGIKEHILNNSLDKNLTTLVELNQYYKANWFNDMGLNAMQNAMKKEAISDSEKQMNQDILKPLITSMYECRKDFCERANKFFGLELDVRLDSAWMDNQIETAITQEAEIQELTEPEPDPKPQGEGSGSEDGEPEQEPEQEPEPEQEEAPTNNVVDKIEKAIEEQLEDVINESEDIKE